jgi:hypothetical protein
VYYDVWCEFELDGEKMEMQLVSVRLPVETLKRLRLVAHEKTMREGRLVSWASLIRNAIDKHVLGDDTNQVVLPHSQPLRPNPAKEPGVDHAGPKGL